VEWARTTAPAVPTVWEWDSFRKPDVSSPVFTEPERLGGFMRPKRRREGTEGGSESEGGEWEGIKRVGERVWRSGLSGEGHVARREEAKKIG
jgi:hypothetical protein